MDNLMGEILRSLVELQQDFETLEAHITTDTRPIQHDFPDGFRCIFNDDDSSLWWDSSHRYTNLKDKTQCTEREPYTVTITGDIDTTHRLLLKLSQLLVRVSKTEYGYLADLPLNYISQDQKCYRTALSVVTYAAMDGTFGRSLDLAPDNGLLRWVPAAIEYLRRFSEAIQQKIDTPKVATTQQKPRKQDVVHWVADEYLPAVDIQMEDCSLSKKIKWIKDNRANPVRRRDLNKLGIDVPGWLQEGHSIQDYFGGSLPSDASLRKHINRAQKELGKNAGYVMRTAAPENPTSEATGKRGPRAPAVDVINDFLANHYIDTPGTEMELPKTIPVEVQKAVKSLEESIPVTFDGWAELLSRHH